MNYNIDKLYNEIVKILNDSGITIASAYYVIKSIMLELEIAKNTAIAQENSELNYVEETDIPIPDTSLTLEEVAEEE